MENTKKSVEFNADLLDAAVLEYARNSVLGRVVEHVDKIENLRKKFGLSVDEIVAYLIETGVMSGDKDELVKLVNKALKISRAAAA